MMTGQILAGEDIHNAIKYQQIIMFLICAASCLSVIACVLMACWIVIDEHARLRVDRVWKSKPWGNPFKAYLPWLFK
jgi:ABC-type iron transport system FetAB permease component